MQAKKSTKKKVNKFPGKTLLTIRRTTSGFSLGRFTCWSVTEVCLPGVGVSLAYTAEKQLARIDFRQLYRREGELSLSYQPRLLRATLRFIGVLDFWPHRPAVNKEPKSRQPFSVWLSPAATANPWQLLHPPTGEQ